MHGKKKWGACYETLKTRLLCWDHLKTREDEVDCVHKQLSIRMIRFKFKVRSM